jgi:hypothetical protein
MNELPEGWTKMNLYELLNKKELKQIKEMLKKDDWKGIDAFLEERKDKLIAKGIVPGFLRYWIEWKKDQLKEVL